MVLNCWEFKKCGRQPGGDRAKELGECSAANTIKVDGTNHGVNGGRCCWAVAGTFCGGKPQGTFINKQKNCSLCEFYKQVHLEEGSNMISTITILRKLR